MVVLQKLFSRKINQAKEKEPEIINIDEFIAVKGIKAIGNQFIKRKVKSINITIPEPLEEEIIEAEESESEEANADSEVNEIPEEGQIGDLFSIDENNE